MIVNEDEKSVNEFIQNFRKEFMSLPVESMAFPRSVNGLKKWSDKSSIFKKGTPMHIKGALIYNHLLKKHKLTNKYQLLQDGEKLKYLLLKTPNILQSNVIAFIGELPKEFELHEQIDRDKQFEKSFVDPIEMILECIDWQVLLIDCELWPAMLVSLSRSVTLCLTVTAIFVPWHCHLKE